MENSDDIRLIVKIAQLYYEQDMTQAQIARELGIYRTTISRLLKRGRKSLAGAATEAKVWPERRCGGVGK